MHNFREISKITISDPNIANERTDISSGTTLILQPNKNWMKVK